MNIYGTIEFSKLKTHKKGEKLINTTKINYTREFDENIFEKERIEKETDIKEICANDA